MNDDEPLLDGLEELPPGAWDLPAGDGGLRQRLLAETTAVVRSRGRRRRVRRYGDFALAYAAGIATAAIVWQGPLTVSPSPPAVRTVEVTTGDGPVQVAAARADESPEVAPTAR